MPDIQKDLEAILAAKYGRDVRGSIHDAIRDINAVVDNNVPTVETLTERAETASASAENSKQIAEEYTQRAETASASAEASADRAMQGTPEGYADVVKNVYSIKKETSESFNIKDTSEGNVLTHKIVGKSVQNGTPSPDNPVEIDSVGDSVNLIPYPYYRPNKFENNGITYTVNPSDLSITANGTATAESVFQLFTRGNNNVKFNTGIHTVNGCPSGGSTSTYCMECGATNDDGSFLRYGYDVGNGSTFDVDKVRSSQLIIIVKSGQTVSNLTFKPMLVKGSEPKPYRPYSNGLQFIEKGKNLIPFPYALASSTTMNGITFVINKDGTVTANGTASEEAYISLINYGAKWNPFKKGKRYRLTGGVSSAQRIRIAAGITSGMISLGNDAGSGVEITRIDEVIDNDYGTRIYIDINKGQILNNVVFKPMLIEINSDGTYPTDYEVYREHNTTVPIEPLRSIGDIADTIDFVDGEYVVTRRIGNKVYDGSEDENWFSYNSSVGGKNRLRVEDNDVPSYPDLGVPNWSNCLKASHFKTALASAEQPFNCVETIGLGVNKGNHFFQMYAESYNTSDSLESWRQYLKTNPLKIIYLKVTPTTEKLTPEQAIALLSMKSFNDKTYIDSLNYVAPEMSIEYATTRQTALALTGHNQTLANTERIKELTTAMIETTALSEEGNIYGF